MTKNHFHKAQTAKNDEFYTTLYDIGQEMPHYKKQFRNKHIFLNCDNPKESNFWLYFEQNFAFFQLKQLTAVYYNKNGTSYRRDLRYECDTIIETQQPLTDNGDFRGTASKQILRECDIVITNPPFSLWREYIQLLFDAKKKFLIIGPIPNLIYKQVKLKVISGEIHSGFSRFDKFIDTDGGITTGAACTWFTNLKAKAKPFLPLTASYDDAVYPKYDDTDIIAVKSIKSIPYNYFGLMGVPTTFFLYHNPKQFKIVSIRAKEVFINGKYKYPPIVVKRV